MFYLKTTRRKEGREGKREGGMEGGREREEGGKENKQMMEEYMVTELQLIQREVTMPL